MILTIGGLGGGTGKTTLACNVAVALARRGSSVLLLDGGACDASSAFVDRRKRNLSMRDVVCFRSAGSDVSTLVGVLRSDFDYIVFDACGTSREALLAGLRASDRFIIPIVDSTTQPGLNAGAIELVESSRRYNEMLAVLGVHNFAASSRGLGGACEPIVTAGMFTHGIGRLSVRKSRIWPDLMAEGLGIADVPHVDDVATAELNAVLRAVHTRKATRAIGYLHSSRSADRRSPPSR